MANVDLVVPLFKLQSVLDKRASAEQNRPIYKDIEVVEIRMAANKQTVGVFPAHMVWKHIELPDGSREPQTYAMRFSDQYQRFKAKEAQVMVGTPLDELPFLKQAKRYELKAQNIFTAEALASLEGQALKNIGMEGGELKEKARAYLEQAKGTADSAKLAAENALLRDEIERLKGTGSEETAASPFQSWEDDDIKAWIKDATGEGVRGNPTHATLVKKADEVNAALAKQAEKSAA